MAQQFTRQIHCPNPEKFPRFAAGFQGLGCKPLGLTAKNDFQRCKLAGGTIINVQPTWLQRFK